MEYLFSLLPTPPPPKNSSPTKRKPAFEQDHSFQPPTQVGCHFPLFLISFSHQKVLPKVTNQDLFPPLSFPNCCLRKPETVIPIPKWDCSFSPMKPSWNCVPHQLATQLSHIAKCEYSPHSEINPLLCQEKKPICPVNLQGHSYLQKTPIIRKLSCNVICNPSESPRLICVARDLLIHTGQGTCSLGFPVQYIWLSLRLPQAQHHKISLGGQSIE